MPWPFPVHSSRAGRRRREGLMVAHLVRSAARAHALHRHCAHTVSTVGRHLALQSVTRAFRDELACVICHAPWGLALVYPSPRTPPARVVAPHCALYSLSPKTLSSCSP